MLYELQKALKEIMLRKDDEKENAVCALELVERLRSEQESGELSATTAGKHFLHLAGNAGLQPAGIFCPAPTTCRA